MVGKLLNAKARLVAVAVAAAAGMSPPARGQAAAAASAPTTTTRPASQPARPPSPPGPRRFEIPPDHLTGLKAFLKEHLPETLEQIERLQEQNPGQARRQLLGVYWLWWRVRHYPPEVRKAAVDRYQLRGAINQAVRRIRQVEAPAEKAKLTGQLRELLGRHFDQDMIVKEHRVTVLAKQLAELKATVQQRRRDRQALLEERLTRILQPPATRPATTRPAPRRRPARRPGLTAEREQELIKFMKENAPELHVQLQRLRKEDPAEARRMLGRVHGLWWRLRRHPPGARKAAIARHQLNVAVARAAAELWKATDPAERAERTRTLRKLLAQQFDQGQLFYEYRVKYLAKQLDELRSDIALRRRSRPKVIAEWMGRLLQPPVASQPAQAPAAS